MSPAIVSSSPRRPPRVPKAGSGRGNGANSDNTGLRSETPGPLRAHLRPKIAHSTTGSKGEDIHPGVERGKRFGRWFFLNGLIGVDHLSTGSFETRAQGIARARRTRQEKALASRMR